MHEMKTLHVNFHTTNNNTKILCILSITITYKLTKLYVQFDLLP